MSRNKFTNDIHTCERIEIEHREKEYAALEQELHDPSAEPVVFATVNEVKAKRSARLDQKRRHKPSRGAAATRSA